MASIMYAEHVGSYLQTAGKSGLIIHWYILTNRMSGNWTIERSIFTLQK